VAIRYDALQNSDQNLSVLQGKRMHQTAKGSLVCGFGGILTKPGGHTSVGKVGSGVSERTGGGSNK